MELRVFDKTAQPLGAIDELPSLLWHTKYFDVGTFSLLAPITDNNSRLLVEGNLITKHDGKKEVKTADGGVWRRAAQITYVHITKDENGLEQLEAQGYMLSWWLNKRCIYPQIVATGTNQYLINLMVKNNCGSAAGTKRRFPLFTFLAQETIDGVAVEYANEVYAQLGQEVKARAQAGKLGYDILLNEREGLFGFYLYKGNDLIEMCVRKKNTKSMGVTDKDWYFEDATVEAAAELTRYLMNKYGVPASHVIRHYDVTGKICPNPYVYNTSAHTWDEFKRKISGQVETPQGGNEKTIWNFLTGKGLNAYAVAGIMGNLYAESGLMPNNLQNTYNNKLGKTDAEYTAAVDNGSYGNFVKDSAGYGLAQWTYWSRKQALLNHAKQAGVSIADLNMQLGFLWEELQGYTAVMDALKKAGSVRAASDAVLSGYEKPAGQSETVKKKRAEYGEGYYKKYAAGNGTKYYRVRKSWTDAASQLGAFTSLENAKSACKAGYTVYDDNGKAVYTTAGQQASAGVPFSVQVDILDLNIRTGAGTNYAKTGEKTGKGVFTIVEVKAGQGASTGWGRLKSGAGWISLDYATRLA